MYKEGDLVVITGNISREGIYHGYVIGETATIGKLGINYCTLRLSSSDKTRPYEQAVYNKDFILANATNRQAVSLLSQED